MDKSEFDVKIAVGVVKLDFGFDTKSFSSFRGFNLL